MAQIVSSTFVPAAPEVDGRRYVTESHTADDGQVYSYTWLCAADIDPQIVMEERAAYLNGVLAARQAARDLVQGTSVPPTRFEFLNRFTAQERVNIRMAAATDPFIDDYLEMLKLSAYVTLTLARPGLAYLVTQNLLTQARADVIGADA